MKSFFLIAFLMLFSILLFAQEQLITVKGRNYNVMIKGLDKRKANAPVVIFESGMGVDLGNWQKVFAALSLTYPVFAYDRAGIGKSDKVFQMPTPGFVAKSLHEILATLKIPPPYVLVGHSLGGVYIRSFAGYYPKEVAGLVFIDPADFTETRNDWNNIFRNLGISEAKIDEMLQNRLYRPAPKLDSLHFGPQSERQVLTELRKTDFKEITDLPLPPISIYFLIGGKFEVPPAQRSKEYDHERFFHIKNSANMDRWRQLIHATGMSGSLIYLSDAGHYVHTDEPKVVVDNIKLLLEKLNK